MRADKLKSMKMPAKPMGEKEADMDLEALMAEESSELPGDESLEAPAHETMEGEMGMEQAPELEMLSDDELLAELKKRGLMGKSSPVGKAAESDMVDEAALEGNDAEAQFEEMTNPPKKAKRK